jgi:RNA recognition motif-containing protein
MRKIFVGGIPKGVDQHGLRDNFSRFGKVQKAWLQNVRQGKVQPQKEHRGFGFVVFCDESAVEKLLGGDSTRYMNLENGSRVEVKRAVSNAEMEFVKQFESVQELQQQHSPEQSRTAARRRTIATGAEAHERLLYQARTHGSTMMDTAPFPLIPFAALPHKPCGEFPGTPSQCARSSSSPMQTFTVKVPPPPKVNAAQVSTDPYRPPQGLCPQMLGVLLKDFNEPRPWSLADLALVLAQAAPEHYED